MDRGAITTWIGGKDGGGTLTCDSGALTNVPYTGRSRFEQEDRPTGANPEEMLASALAASYTMALADRLTAAGHPPNSIRTEARLHVIKPGGHWTVPTARLDVVVALPSLTGPALMQHASEARTACLVTQALRVDVTVTATLAPVGFEHAPARGGAVSSRPR